MTQSDAEHALDYAELRHVPTEDEIGYESLPYSPEKLRQIKEYLDNPGPYNAQSRQSTEGRYARAILADLIDARAELQAERERVRQMEEALRTLIADIDRWEDAMQKIVGKREYPWGTLEEARSLLGQSSTRKQEK